MFGAEDSSIIELLVLVLAVMNIILFIKIWIMTNDISDIKKYMQWYIKKELKNKTE